MEALTTFKHLEDLDPESKYLVHRAREATEHSYAPYSKFHVGAAIMLDDGTFLTGVNLTDGAAAASGASDAPDPAQSINRVVLRQLKVDEAVHLDKLVETCEEVSPSEIIASLFEMEIQGLVKQLPGRNFIKVW